MRFVQLVVASISTQGLSLPERGSGRRSAVRTHTGLIGGWGRVETQRHWQSRRGALHVLTTLISLAGLPSVQLGATRGLLDTARAEGEYTTRPSSRHGERREGMAWVLGTGEALSILPLVLEHPGRANVELAARCQAGRPSMWDAAETGMEVKWMHRNMEFARV